MACFHAVGRGLEKVRSGDWRVRGSRREQELVSGVLKLAEGLAEGGEFSDRMTLLCRATSQLLHCDRCSVFLLEGKYYRAKFNHGNPPDIAAVFHKHRVGLRDPFILKAMTSRNFVVVNDAQRDSLMNQKTARRARIRAIAIAPLFRKAEPLGFITAEYNENRGSFSALNSTLLLGIAKIGELIVQGQEAIEKSSKLEHEIRTAERLEALTRMAGGLAHDFNNCLTVILGTVELLRMEPEGLNRDSAIEDIQLSAERAANLTRRLLHFSRGSMEEVGVVNASAAIRALEGTLRRSVPMDIELAFHIGRRDSFATCSPGEFEQIVINLVLNAANASQSGARVGVRLVEGEMRTRGRDDSQRRKPRACIVLSVSDTGRGIPPADIGRLFEPFFTTSATGEGTGLGLSTVYGIVTKAGGEIQVDSEVGIGSEFRVYLPSAERDQGPQRVERRARNDTAIVSPTILVVDDDEPVRRMAAEAIRGWGTAQVIEAASAGQARERAAAHEGVIHLLVTDVVMPEEGGRDLARDLVKARPGLKVLFTSGYSPEMTEERGVAQTVEHFLAKPFTRVGLIEKVSEVLGGTGANSGA